MAVVTLQLFNIVPGRAAGHTGPPTTLYNIHVSTLAFLDPMNDGP